MPKRAEHTESPSSFLDKLAQEALALARKARRHNKSLGGDNYYGNRLAQLRADATNAFSDLSIRSPGDTAALAELVETSFAAHTSQRDRLSATRELSHALRTKWKEPREQRAHLEMSFFPWR
ncbi:MAG: hypothetical protein WA728_05695 [Xanthobacteraceae bacterium]